MLAAVVVSAHGTTAGAISDPVSAPPEIPIHSQAQVLGVLGSGTPLVLTAHGVQRLERGTIVYYSAAFPPHADPDASVSGALGGSSHIFGGGVANTGCDVAVIDQVGAKVYLPLSDRDLCTRGMPRVEPGEARVQAVMVPRLPDEATVVDISVHGTILPSVPVGDGEFTPADPNDESDGPLLGMGWPILDPSAIPDDTDEFIRPLRQAVADLDHEITETSTTVEISGDVLFAKNKFDINAAGREVIDRAVEQLKAKDGAGTTLIVIGHTDSDGDDASNQVLSENRAKGVAAALQEALGGAYTITAEGRGESEPVASNDTDEGKALNRRVTIEIAGGDE